MQDIYGHTLDLGTTVTVMYRDSLHPGEVVAITPQLIVDIDGKQVTTTRHKVLVATDWQQKYEDLVLPKPCVLEPMENNTLYECVTHGYRGIYHAVSCEYYGKSRLQYLEEEVECLAEELDQAREEVSLLEDELSED